MIPMTLHNPEEPITYEAQPKPYVNPVCIYTFMTCMREYMEKDERDKEDERGVDVK